MRRGPILDYREPTPSNRRSAINVLYCIWVAAVVAIYAGMIAVGLWIAVYGPNRLRALPIIIVMPIALLHCGWSLYRSLSRRENSEDSN